MKQTKILLVDDEMPFLSVLTQALHKVCDFHGIINTVECGEKAIAAVSSDQYDICFLDVNLPDANGLDIMKQIRNISPDTKIAIMTGEHVTEDMMQSIAKDATIFVAKPVDLSLIKSFIKQYDGHGYANGGNYEKRRKYDRRPSSLDINFSLTLFNKQGLNLDRKANVIDLSNAGIGLLTNYPLEQGQLLRFDQNIAYKIGLVKWVTKIDDKYRAGIKLQ
jgi:CheY-like chemotaxis protein